MHKQIKGLFLVCALCGTLMLSGCTSSGDVITGPHLGRDETGAVTGSVLKYNDTRGLWVVGVDNVGGGGGGLVYYADNSSILNNSYVFSVNTSWLNNSYYNHILSK